MKGMILAGGKGSRLWPLSRENYPKQFLRLKGEHSFLQQTIQRSLECIAKEDLFILTSHEYRLHIIHQIEAIDPALKKNIIFEPLPRNTAPALIWALKYLQEKHALKKEDVICLLPSDHVITPHRDFAMQLQQANLYAQEGNLVTLGIPPSSAQTGYGYIKAVPGERGALFKEKPSLKKAQEYCSSGQYFWNSGIFIFTVETIIREFKTHAPQMYTLLEKSLEEAHQLFPSLPDLSLDYALMEKSQQITMLPLNLSWSDVGSWESFFSLMEKDGNHNVIQGRVSAIDTKHSLIVAEKRLVVALGVENVAIIETDDAVLVAHQAHSQKVKEAVSQLKLEGKTEVQEHPTTKRPWGAYTVLEEGKRHKIKRICVAPLQKLSLQMHYHRSEHWVVVKGTAKVTIGEELRIVHEGESIFVPKSAPHCVENPGKIPLEIIEVQVGEYLGEDDIIRFKDNYGRATSDQCHVEISS